MAIKESKPLYKQKPWTVLLVLVLYPWGVYSIWKIRTAIWIKLLYTVVGLPIFIVVFAYLSIVVFASFLPPLDTSIGNRKDRSLRNIEGQYDITILKSARETKGQYELVQVTLQPGGGNDWHYHKKFTEHFKVLKGELMIGKGNGQIKLTPGKEAKAEKSVIHRFYNTSNEPVVFEVMISPASNFEKTLRTAYGLMKDGKVKDNGIPKNPWHLFLLLGYSDTYLPGKLPGFIQEPLILSLAKIAQWKGDHKELEPYFN